MIDELRESPATLTLAALWVVVFVMMQLRQSSFESNPNPFTFGAVEVSTSHKFGDATSAELAAGQVWRAVTSTFIHFSLLHLLLNLFCLVQLGPIVEGWYGSPLFLIIYLLVGGLGNLFAGFTRPSFGIPDYAHSGGGSTVVFGLIGLCAIVGWRSRTAEGRDLFLQMFVFLILNVLLSVAFWFFRGAMGSRMPNLDNLAHLGGTLAGTVIGLGHRTMIRQAEKRSSRGFALAGALLLFACMGAQARSNQAEVSAEDQQAIALERWQDTGARIADLAWLEQIYLIAHALGKSPLTPSGPSVPDLKGPDKNTGVPVAGPADLEREMTAVLQRLQAAKDVLGTGPTTRAYERLLTLASQAINTPPTSLKVQEFQAYLSIVFQRAQQEYQAAQKRIIEMTQRKQRR